MSDKFAQFNSFREDQKHDFLNCDEEELISRLTSYGYFPEGNIFPPCFVGNVKHPDGGLFYPLNKSKNKPLTGLNKNETTDLVSIITPKGQFHDRVFSIMNPKMYNDLVYNLIKDRRKMAEILFPDTPSYIYSYSIPLPPKPVSNTFFVKKILEPTRNLFSFLKFIVLNIKDLFLGKRERITYLKKRKFLRKSGRGISHYLEGEDHLLESSYLYHFYLQTDVKNFYPSIYTHGIAWALEGKDVCRKNIGEMHLLGNRVDILFQKSHDNCTNGICIGPTISDFVGEIILSSVDQKVSANLSSQNIDFIGMRYKDDYRILSKTEEDAKKILKILNEALLEYKLYLNESKTILSPELPGSIFREWIIKVDHLINSYLISSKNIDFKMFKILYAKVLEIHEQYPGHAVFEKILSKLIDKNLKLKISLASEREARLFITLLLQIKNKRLQSLPIVLGILEILMDTLKNQIVDIDNIVYEILLAIFDNLHATEYELLRIGYFLKKKGREHSTLNSKLKASNNVLLKSLGANKQYFFEDFNLFNSDYKSDRLLRTYIEPFGYDMI